MIRYTEQWLGKVRNQLVPVLYVFAKEEPPRRCIVIAELAACPLQIMFECDRCSAVEWVCDWHWRLDPTQSKVFQRK
jgi:hypothetical protein